jgi:hypothetical protein
MNATYIRNAHKSSSNSVAKATLNVELTQCKEKQEVMKAMIQLDNARAEEISKEITTEFQPKFAANRELINEAKNYKPLRSHQLVFAVENNPKKALAVTAAIIGLGAYRMTR